MAASTKRRILTLYKHLLRESSKITDYNFRLYFLRKTRDTFVENRHVTATKELQALVKKADEHLQMLRRLVVVSQLFRSDKLVIETQSGKLQT
ncbi:hypothetical protein BsWGS_22760 [Bradybaena similaris]